MQEEEDEHVDVVDDDVDHPYAVEEVDVGSMKRISNDDTDDTDEREEHGECAAIAVRC